MLAGKDLAAYLGSPVDLVSDVIPLLVPVGYEHDHCRKRNPVRRR
jgi:hypothetical protein